MITDNTYRVGRFNFYFDSLYPSQVVPLSHFLSMYSVMVSQIMESLSVNVALMVFR